jgi:hypothetical protein
VDAATAVACDQRLGGAIVQDFKNTKNPISRAIIAQMGDASRFL